MTQTQKRALQPVRLTVLISYAIAVEWIAIRAGEPTELWWWLLEIPFFLWIIAPIAASAATLRSLPGLIILALIAAYSIYVYELDMFGSGARSTSALVFVFFPIYQWGAVVTLGITERLIMRVASRSLK